MKMAQGREESEDELRMVTEDDDGEEEETLSQQAGKQPKPCKWPCLKCGKSVTRSGVRCGVCFLWVHVKCQNMPKEMYNFLKAPAKYQEFTWRCDSCSASVAMLDDKVTAIKKELEEVKSRMVVAEGNVQEVTRKVENVEKRQDKVEEIIEGEREKAKRERIEESREREQRRKNVVIYRLPEAGGEISTVEQRKEWDLGRCDLLFKELKMPWDKTAIRFCRRIGEKGEEPRPLVVGFNREWQKEDLLDSARELRNTPFSVVGIAPDLTQEQRQEEVELGSEAERRNRNLTEDDVSKNLLWKVVGRKGEKRLLKVTAREEDRNQSRGGGRGAAGGRGRGQRLLTSRGRGSGWQPTRGGGARGMAERENLLDLVRSGPRNRINSKRARPEEDSGEAEEERPPPTAASRQGANGSLSFLYINAQSLVGKI